MTAPSLLGMEWTSWRHFARSIFFHSSRMTSFRDWMLDGECVTVQKARDPIASETESLFGTLQIQWCEEINGRAVQIYRPCRCRSHRQCRCSEPGRASLTPGQRIQSGPIRESTETWPGENSLRTWKTDRELTKPPAKQRSDNASQKRQPDIGSADELHL